MNRPANKPAVLYVTPGEPAGVGPELVLKALPQLTGIPMAIVADRTLLENTARSMGLSEDLFSSGDIEIIHCPLIAPVIPGQLNPANSEYVLTTLQRAANLCLENHGSGLVTAPVHKGVINDSGIAFTGHTEFLADIAGVNRVVMMLANESFRVALVTTHLPLADVSSAINTANVKETIEIVAREMQSKFSVSQPRINVCGLNPHAGEGGHLGGEEISYIEPAIRACREAGILVNGPLPADTAFTTRQLDQCDATIAMYHDQGLPVLKYAGFGKSVNITLGLPFVRTSVDHGTALDIAGSGTADPGSLIEAVKMAHKMVAE